MRKSRIAVAGGAAAVVALMSAGPALAEAADHTSKATPTTVAPTTPGNPGEPTKTEKPTTPPTSPTAKPTHSHSAEPTPTSTAPKTFKVTVSPKYFHAGDTLHVTVYKCPTKPSVHSQILTGGAHWTHSEGVWKTPVQVAKGLRTGYYKFTVTCKGYNPVVFKVRYGHPSGGNGSGAPSKPVKHNPHGQTKVIPNGGASTGGGSTAKTFV